MWRDNYAYFVIDIFVNILIFNDRTLYVIQAGNNIFLIALIYGMINRFGWII